MVCGTNEPREAQRQAIRRRTRAFLQRTFSRFAICKARRLPYDTRELAYLFSSEQLLIELFKDISTQPRDLLGRVFAHIRVSSEVHWNQFPFEQNPNRASKCPRSFESS